MATPSITQFVQNVNQARDNSTSQVLWEGEYGMYSFLMEIAAMMLGRTSINVADTTALALIGGSDSKYASCTGENGQNIYEWFPNIDSSATGAVTSSKGGQWRPIFGVTAPIEGPWTTNDEDDIIPKDAYLNNGVAIGQANASPSTWLDFIGVGGDGKGRGIRFPALTTLQINSGLITTLIDNLVMYNSTDKMLVRYDEEEANTKSVGVWAGRVNTNLLTTVDSYEVAIPEQHVNSYSIFCTPENSFTGTLFQSKAWYVDKLNDSFTINFPGGTGTGQLKFSYQISH